MKMGRKTIVIAKVEMSGLRPTGRLVRRDYNDFQEMEPAPEAKACIWLNKGTDADIEDAKRRMPEYTVYTFPTSERDPLGKAKTAALEAFAVKN